MSLSTFIATACLALMVAASPALSATSQSYQALDRATATACIRASGLRDGHAGAVTRFSDTAGVDARTVTGVWPQAHMRGARATLLCLYDRRTRRAETQELASGAATPLPPRPTKLRDAWWQAREIGGMAVVNGAEVTLMLGSDGKVGGRSGCNNYSANYRLDGAALKVFPPMIGTRMACAPAAMAQEDRYRQLLELAQRAEIRQDGSLVLSLEDGRTLRFTASE